MSKPEHSPLPWAWEKSDGYDRMGWVVCPKKHQSIGCTNIENGEFIVTACNSYYDNQSAIVELVEALDRFIESAENAKCVLLEQGYDLTAMDLRDFGKKARAFIAKHKEARQ